MKKENLKIGMILKSPNSGETYEVTALGKRYLLVEVKTSHSSHEFPRRYDEIENYTEEKHSDEENYGPIPGLSIGGSNKEIIRKLPSQPQNFTKEYLLSALDKKRQEAIEDAVLQSAENMGAPEISSCQIEGDQAYFYDINGYLSMIIPKEALEELLRNK